MQNTENLVVDSKTAITTQTVSIEAFNIEMNAKNRAYAFILHSKLFNEFSEFCKATNGINPHDICLTILNNQ